VYAAHRVADIINGQLLLFFVLPGTDFPGPEDTSSRVELMSPIGIAIEVLVAAMLVAALAPVLRGGRRWWPAIMVAGTAMVFTFLVSASCGTPHRAPGPSARRRSW
jgi:uncharacterized membrane protein YozB (DUF420 family)